MNHTITLTNEQESAVQRDASNNNMRIEDLLLSWLEPNLDDSMVRQSTTSDLKLLSALKAAKDSDTKKQITDATVK